jgi:molybdopterin biosynthesis enzyme
LLAPCFVSPRSTELAQALRAQMAQGAQLLVVAGSRPMDPLDPMYEALDQIDARIERQGMPAHPGSLLWVGYAKPSDGVERTIVGLPSCGLFSQASVFDLLMPKLLTGERLTNKSLAELGHGGLLTRDMQFRFPPYRSGARRGEVLEE